jgi:hypothetical protein
VAAAVHQGRVVEQQMDVYYVWVYRVHGVGLPARLAGGVPDRASDV